MKSELLIEIGFEEIPASYLKPATDKLSSKLSSHFKEKHVDFKETKIFFTPRRLAVLFREIDNYEKKIPKIIYGPPADRSFDDTGKATAAATGFAKSYNKAVKDLKIGEKKGKKFCYLEIVEKPKRTELIVKEILPSILEELNFPKKMKWEESGFEFARPIRWIVVLFCKQSIKLKIAGVTSSNKSFGPRFLGSKKLIINDTSSYEKILEKNFVIPSFEKRKKKIINDISKYLKSSEKLIDDPGLLNEVTNLVEYPSVFKGKFDKEFLVMPSDVLVTAMREHQRYFAVFNENKKIESVYIGVSNSLNDNIKEITKGHNNVLKARLNDALFYWKEDLKQPLVEMIDELKGVEWHRGLGTVFDKTIRLVKLSRFLSKIVNRGKVDVIERGALLSKADLVTNMIKDGKEFTKLEGIIGREYALQSNEKREVAEIISEHYLPRFPQDALPSTIESAIVGVSDRIDTLVGNFLLGEIPTGSVDPFGLRRCAYGLVRIIDEFKLRFDFNGIVKKCIWVFSQQNNVSKKISNDETIQKLKEFLYIRLKTYLSILKISYDTADAVFSVYFDDIYDALERIKTLNDERGSENFERLVIGQRRVANILRGVKIGQKQVNESLFDCKAETTLWKKYNKIKGDFFKLMTQHKYKKVNKSLLTFCPHIDNFFDNCLVMTDDVRRKNNRISMLYKIKALFDEFADFSMIVIEGERTNKDK
ncbi:glycine--tRNA ligase subunit beta [candidate division WOR-3 bacterium]|nr:glycine--tRNA ligase subunit beta [candidate division WOR-3 bacterium]